MGKASCLNESDSRLKIFLSQRTSPFAAPPAKGRFFYAKLQKLSSLLYIRAKSTQKKSVKHDLFGAAFPKLQSLPT